ncbi:pollen-specific leucine-rich repeat extensin-like protein 4 [Iris pallida]|uniref:Pollen-specific leucine-rich repeat extensin-like protein 4 n=1 Tax=Iris pallida TaxID=29817 RepID=A0AAX6EK15_IRIPA|nr:pollen-specific leucine-rich repeat extensin-like protein 4 [Iris pallida]
METPRGGEVREGWIGRRWPQALVWVEGFSPRGDRRTGAALRSPRAEGGVRKWRSWDLTLTVALRRSPSTKGRRQPMDGCEVRRAAAQRGLARSSRLVRRKGFRGTLREQCGGSRAVAVGVMPGSVGVRRRICSHGLDFAECGHRRHFRRWGSRGTTTWQQHRRSGH